MPEERFDIVFAGELIKGADPAKARKQVQQIFKISDTQLKRLFSGKPVTIKKGVGMESAVKYRLAFRRAGALIQIRPSAAPSSGKLLDNPTNWQLLPPNSGSLAQFAPKLNPKPLPDISSMTTSAPGATLDETPEPPPARIDTGALGLMEGEWSLEDCQPPPLPQVEPNIDHLGFAAPGDTSHIPEEPPAPPPPEISAMDFAARDDTSHIPPEPPAAPLPDISSMTLEEPEEKEDTDPAAT